MIEGRQVRALIMARMGSQRLPGKALLPLGGGSILDAVHDRVAASQVVDEMRVATSEEAGDDPIAEWAAKRGVPITRGSETDVLGRMVAATADLDERDLVVRANADNPLVIGDLISQACEQLIASGAEVLTPFEWNALPFGTSATVLEVACLRRMHREVDDAVHREHVESYALDHPDQFRVAYQVAPEGLHAPELSLTVDTAADWERVRQIAVDLGAEWGIPELRCLIAGMRRDDASVPAGWKIDPRKTTADERLGFRDPRHALFPASLRLLDADALARSERERLAIEACRWPHARFHMGQAGESDQQAWFDTAAIDGRGWLVDPVTHEPIVAIANRELVELWTGEEFHRARLEALNRRGGLVCLPPKV